MATSHKQPYHHGNLRQALLDSALETLEAEGLEKLSLRGLAKSLGVSPTAVYGHFADKTDLLIALHTGGFKVLREALERALEELPKAASGEDRVRALGLAYMQFARERPHLFDAMFFWRPDLCRVTQEQLQEGVGSERVLRDTIIDMLKEEGVELSAAQAAVASFSAWALVHGISTLVRTGAVEGAVHCEKWPEDFSSFHPNSRQEQVIRQILDIQIAGLKASAQALSRHD